MPDAEITDISVLKGDALESSKRSRVTRTSVVIALMLVLCWIALTLRILSQHPNTSYGGRDEIKYWLLAKMDVDLGVAPPVTPQYPPGWPTLLALNFRLGGDVVAAHLLSLSLMWLGILLASCYWLPRAGVLPAAAMALLFASHRTTLNLGDKLLSEPFFLACLAATVLTLSRFPAGITTSRQAFAGGLLATLCRAVRTAGIAVTGGLLLHLAVRRDMKFTRRIVCGLAIVLPLCLFEFWLIARHNPGAAIPGGGYVAQLVDLSLGAGNSADDLPPNLAGIADHLLAHTKNLASVAIPLSPDFWKPELPIKAAGVLIVLAGLAELMRVLWSKRDVTACIVLVYLLVVYAWPYYSLRFFWPVVPFLWYYAYSGTLRVAARFGARPARVAVKTGPVILAGVGLLAFACAMWKPAPGREYAVKDLEAYAQALDWIEDNSAEEIPRLGTVSYYRAYFLQPTWDVVPLAYRDDPESQTQLIRAHDVTWIVERRHKADKYFAGLQRTGFLREVHEVSSVVVFAVVSDPGT